MSTMLDLQHPSPMTPAEYEDRYWPAKIMGAEVSNYLVPIKVPFAEDARSGGTNPPAS